MEKCRLCLCNRRNLRSIRVTDGDVSFADMIFAVANVKIMKEEETGYICKLCVEKLKDAYDFRILIQRSDMALRENGTKRIQFNNLNDIKVEIEIIKNEPQDIIRPSNNIVETCFKDGVTSVCYNETIIKKKYDILSTDGPVNQKQPVSVMEFLENFNPDDDDSHGYDCADNVQEYVHDAYDDCLLSQPLGTRKKNKSKRNNNVQEDDDYTVYTPSKLQQRKQKLKNTKKDMYKASQNNKLSIFLPIKPVFLEDVRVKATPSTQNCTSRKRRVSKIPRKYCDSAKKKICPYCGKLMTSLKYHILLHTEQRNFKCDKCSKAFVTEKALEIHKRIHSQTKDFKCDQCVAAFNTKNALKSHILMHIDVKNYICNVCNKAFKRKTALARHIRIHNSINKTYFCELCNMSFNTTCGLKHHMRVHTGERPFKCEICSQPYSYKHDFNRHCFKKHGVFIKRRSVYVMNEEVLKTERALMRDLMLKMNGVIKDDKPLNPFTGPQAAIAFEQTIKALDARQIPIDLQL